MRHTASLPVIWWSHRTGRRTECFGHHKSAPSWNMAPDQTWWHTQVWNQLECTSSLCCNIALNRAPSSFADAKLWFFSTMCRAWMLAAWVAYSASERVLVLFFCKPIPPPSTSNLRCFSQLKTACFLLSFVWQLAWLLTCEIPLLSILNFFKHMPHYADVPSLGTEEIQENSASHALLYLHIPGIFSSKRKPKKTFEYFKYYDNKTVTHHDKYGWKGISNKWNI